jgi:putative hydrolase of the HAD superfamily
MDLLSQSQHSTINCIRVIFFDAAGTLIHLPRGAAFHYAEVAARHGLQLDEEVLRSAFRISWKEMPIPTTTRTARPDDDRGWWRELVDRTLDRANAPASFDRQAYFTELYAEFSRPGIWAIYPEVPSVLAALQQRFALGIISNFDGRLRPVLAQLGLEKFFQEIVISSEVGADKPDPWIFWESARRFGIEPATALHVGDEPEVDWKGAAAAGFQVFPLDRSSNSLRDLVTQLEALR